MASKSSSVDRDVTVTMMGCPYCIGKFPTEEKGIVRCIYCHNILYIEEDYFGAYPLIDEVFTDHKKNLYRILHVGQQITLMGLSSQKMWTTIKRCSQEDYDRAKPRFLTGDDKTSNAFNIPFVGTRPSKPKKDGKKAAANDDS